MRSRYDQNGKEYGPETLSLGLGYDAFLSEGSIKPPMFLTSTFKFKTAEEGKHYFELVYGKCEREQGEQDGLVYSRLNNPNLQICEERISAWDKTDKGAVFSSGMSAISTTMLAFLKPGDHVIATMPVYGGTFFLFKNILPKYGMNFHMIPIGDDAPQKIREKIKEIGAENVKIIYSETPSNPSNKMADIEELSKITKELNSDGREEPAITVVDNTFLGPVFQRPIEHGADLCVYSATKFISGHSDLDAGVVTGKEEFVNQVVLYRTILGTQSSPHDGWLITRSLETLSVRMHKQQENAIELANLLNEHPKVNWVSYPTLFAKDSDQYRIWKKQTLGSGALISFEVKGGEAAAFKVLNNVSLYGLAVSLGGTESLIEHPMTMTHADVPEEKLEEIGVTPGVVRISTGIENIDDLKNDILAALETV
jgi:methionine-gamma-lyase